MPRAVIFVNGHIPDLELVRGLTRPGDTILAADGGSDHILALGLAPSVIIGDLDSLTPDARRLMEQSGTRLIQHPRDKNETDFELALDYAVESGYRAILIVAALGDRLDQTLGNLALLTSPRFSTVDISFDDGMEEAFFTRTSFQVRGLAGDLVSLIPWGGKVTGVITDGLLWPLRGETLYPYKTRGISNELLGGMASVSLKSGLLLIIHRRLH
jgi:thiamine pyrophosphokinase